MIMMMIYLYIINHHNHHHIYIYIHYRDTCLVDMYLYTNIVLTVHELTFLYISTEYKSFQLHLILRYSFRNIQNICNHI